MSDRERTMFDPDDLYLEPDHPALNTYSGLPSKMVVRRSDGTVGWEGTMDEFVALADKIAKEADGE